MIDGSEGSLNASLMLVSCDDLSYILIVDGDSDSYVAKVGFEVLVLQRLKLVLEERLWSFGGDPIIPQRDCHPHHYYLQKR